MDAPIRLLVVDDELPNLHTFQRVYRRLYDITVAPSGADGLAALGAREFDVVLSDFGMPGMSGAELVLRGRELQQVTFVMVTGYTNHPEVLELEATGAVFTIIGKPWDRHVMVDVIARASERTRAMRAART